MSESAYPCAPPPGRSEPQTSGQAHPAGPRPRTVSTAITLVWVAIGLYLLSIVVLLASGYLAETFAAAEGAGGTGAQLAPDVLAVMPVVVAVVGGFFLLLYVGFGVLLALMLAAGRSWPRIVLAVVAGLLTLGLVLNVVQVVVFAVNGPSLFVPIATPVIPLVLDALEVAAVVAAVVLLFQRPSSAWFAQRRAQRLRAMGQGGVGLPGGEGGFPHGGQRPDLDR